MYRTKVDESVMLSLVFAIVSLSGLTAIASQLAPIQRVLLTQKTAIASQLAPIQRVILSQKTAIASQLVSCSHFLSCT